MFFFVERREGRKDKKRDKNEKKKNITKLDISEKDKEIMMWCFEYKKKRN